MAKLPLEIVEILERLERLSLDIVDAATATELALFATFGETDETLPFLDELKTVSEDAVTSFSQLSTLRLNVALSQPDLPRDMLELLEQVTSRIEARIPAWERSIVEVKTEWGLL